jgi:hypothetical protein
LNVPIVLRLIRCRCRVSHSISYDIDDLHHSQPSRRNGINTSRLLRAIAAPVASSNSISPFIVAIVVVSRGQTCISTMIPPQVSFFVVRNLFPAGKLQDYDLSTCATVLLSNQSVLSCVQLQQIPWIQTHTRDQLRIFTMFVPYHSWVVQE